MKRATTEMTQELGDKICDAMNYIRLADGFLDDSFRKESLRSIRVEMRDAMRTLEYAVKILRSARLYSMTMKTRMNTQ
jgi:hypothetical protein